MKNNLAAHAQTLVARAHDLAAVYETQARPSEKLRRPTDAAIEALRESELLRLMVPECHGGLGLDLDTFVEVILPLGEADASLAWVTSFYIEHNWMFALFPESFQHEFFADRDFVLAPAALAPAGGARRTQKGYELTGRWSWATGVMHAEWAILGGFVEDNEQSADALFFAVPSEEIDIEDVWFASGMCGTGSNDIVVENLQVPEERALSIREACAGRSPGAALHDEPLYRTPMFPLLASAAGLPAVGQARGLVRRFRERLGERRLMGGRLQADHAVARSRLGAIETQVHGAEVLLRDAVNELCTLRDRATRSDRVRLRARIAAAVHESRRAIVEISRASGAAAQLLDSPFQRGLRDVTTLSSHLVFDLDAIYEMHGAALLGDEPEIPFV